MGSLPTLIERLRVEQGLTYEQIATRAGVDGDTVSRYAQRRVKRPRLLTLKRVADALGADVWELLRDLEEGR